MSTDYNQSMASEINIDFKTTKEFTLMGNIAISNSETNGAAVILAGEARMFAVELEFPDFPISLTNEQRGVVWDSVDVQFFSGVNSAVARTVGIYNGPMEYFRAEVEAANLEDAGNTITTAFDGCFNLRQMDNVVWTEDYILDTVGESDIRINGSMIKAGDDFTVTLESNPSLFVHTGPRPAVRFTENFSRRAVFRTLVVKWRSKLTLMMKTFPFRNASRSWIVLLSSFT